MKVNKEELLAEIQRLIEEKGDRLNFEICEPETKPHLLTARTFMSSNSEPITIWEGEKKMKDRTDGACLRNAFYLAGINTDIPDWTLIDDLPLLCQQLEVTWHGPGSISLGVEPVIAIYKTSPGKAHAEYVTDIGSILERGEEIIGIITFQSASSSPSP